MNIICSMVKEIHFRWQKLFFFFICNFELCALKPMWKFSFVENWRDLSTDSVNTLHWFSMRYKTTLYAVVTDARFSHKQYSLVSRIYSPESYLCCYSMPRTFRKYWHSMNSHGRWASILVCLTVFYFIETHNMYENYLQMHAHTFIDIVKYQEHR